MRGSHVPRRAKPLEYKFSTPPVNVVVYVVEYDKLRQLCGAGHARLYKAIAKGWDIIGAPWLSPAV
jgi:hypothetical protein